MLKSSIGNPVFGVKGASVLTPYLNIVKDTPIDYMHGVLEGVTKTLLHKFWLNGKYKDYRFYLNKHIKSIDVFLLKIKPPHEFRRSPRSLEKSGKYWKASELKAWLLYYCIPTLFDLLHADYLLHLSLLVKSMHILLNSEISLNDLEMAKKMLHIFYKTIVQLYPQEVCTMNVHSLIHLCKTVRNYGPLWCYSSFAFESMNGHLKLHCHGTRNVLPQLVRNLRFHQRTLNDKYSSDIRVDGIRGKIKQSKLSVKLVKALKDGHFVHDNEFFMVFMKYKHKGVLYCAAKNVELKRDSSYCKFISKQGTILYGSILTFCLSGNDHVAIIEAYEIVQNALDGIKSNIVELNSFTAAHPCVFKIYGLKSLHAVLVTSLLNKCIHISMQEKDYDIITPISNPYEHH